MRKTCIDKILRKSVDVILTGLRVTINKSVNAVKWKIVVVYRINMRGKTCSNFTKQYSKQYFHIDTVISHSIQLFNKKLLYCSFIDNSIDTIIAIIRLVNINLLYEQT